MTAYSIGVIYILARSLGKYFGAWISASAMRCEANVKRYLGITLLPQAGVALGMCITAAKLGDYEGGLIRNVVLFGVLVYELVGPMMTRNALMRAGEITPAGSDDKERRRAFRRKTA